MMREGLSHWDPADLRRLTELLSRYSEDFAALTTKHIEDNKHGKTDDDKHGKTTEDGH